MTDIDQKHSYDIQGARGSETQATKVPGITPNSSTERLAQTIIDQYSGEIVRAALGAKPAVKNSVQVSPKVVASVIFAEQTSVGPLESQMDLMASLAGNDKTSVMFSIKDGVGALHDILKPFSAHNINMTKIESRPFRNKPWEYIFFIDIEGHQEDGPVRAALDELARDARYLKVLGSYPRSSRMGS